MNGIRIFEPVEWEVHDRGNKSCLVAMYLLIDTSPLVMAYCSPSLKSYRLKPVELCATEIRGGG